MSKSKTTKGAGDERARQARAVRAGEAFVEIFAASRPRLPETVQRALEKASRENVADLKAAIAKAEAENAAAWLDATGETPPRVTLNTLAAAVDWWQERAALAGIDPNKILDAAENVVWDFSPIIRGRLGLLKLQAAAIAAQEAAPTAGQGPAQNDAQAMSADARALAVLAEHADWTPTQIAKKIGVSRTSLYRLPQYQKARKLLKRSGQDEVAGGTKPAEGPMEAWDRGGEDDEEDAE